MKVIIFWTFSCFNHFCNLCYVGQWAVNLPLLCDSIQIWMWCVMITVPENVTVGMLYHMHVPSVMWHCTCWSPACVIAVLVQCAWWIMCMCHHIMWHTVTESKDGMCCLCFHCFPTSVTKMRFVFSLQHCELKTVLHTTNWTHSFCLILHMRCGNECLSVMPPCLNVM